MGAGKSAILRRIASLLSSQDQAWYYDRGVADSQVAESRAAPAERRVLAELLTGPELDAELMLYVEEGIDSAWKDLVRRYGVRTGYQVAHQAGYEGADPTSYWRPLVREHQLLRVSYRRKPWFPGFQFLDGEPLPMMRSLLNTILPAWSELSVALWAAAPNGWLSGERPADLLREDPDQVIKAAERAVASTE
jgi:hypothetical protein